MNNETTLQKVERCLANVKPTVSEGYFEYLVKTRFLETVCDGYTEKKRSMYGREIAPCPERCSVTDGCPTCKKNWARHL